MFLLILAHLGSPAQRAIKQLLVLCYSLRYFLSYGRKGNTPRQFWLPHVCMEFVVVVTFVIRHGV